MEPQAEQQLRNLAQLSFLFHHVAVMPDVHWGLGATVGSVLATVDAVIPAAVGVDIGCGVSATCLPLRGEDVQKSALLPVLREAIERVVPVGFAQHDPGRVSRQSRQWAKVEVLSSRLRAPIVPAVMEKARLQVGTLGGGNHFVEVCHDEQGRVWVMLHSGSRHIGKKIADHYIRAAKARRRQSGELQTLPDANLAFFRKREAEFEDYLHDLYWAQNYARFNREEMMRRILEAFDPLLLPLARAEAAGGATRGKSPRKGATLHGLATERVDCHHNYVARETHFGREVFVTRKGALSAKKGELGVIPGSMGSASYIVAGKGHPESFCSCAHGAGRAMGRKEARRRFTVADLARQTEGVECRKDEGVLDEIPSAYKNIDQVMAAQQDLVEIRHRLTQLICVKG